MDTWEMKLKYSLSDLEKSILKVLHGSKKYLTRDEVQKEIPDPKPEVTAVGGTLSNMFHDGFCMRMQYSKDKKLVSAYCLAPKPRQALSEVSL